MANKIWTPEELEYFESSWGTVPIPGIAKHLGRSINAIKVKSVRLGLGRHLHSGVRITLHQFCRAIGKKASNDLVKNTWVQAGFPIHYQKSVTKRFAMVDIEEFWEWARDHKNLVDFSLISEGIFGVEPEWVKEARYADISDAGKRGIGRLTKMTVSKCCSGNTDIHTTR